MARPETLAIALLMVAAVAYSAQKRREKEPETQVLELPKEPPAYVTADASRLVFRSAPLQSRGLLSQQVRHALRSLVQANRGASIVKLRAFVAGTGDMRRVQAIVSDEFSGKRLSLPAMTVVQVGALTHPGAQVALESIAAGKKAVNPHGLAFLPAQGAAVDEQFQPVLPLFEKAMARLEASLKSAGLERGDLLAATCYLSSLENAAAVRERAYQMNPRTMWSFVQPAREPLESRAECEAVARLRTPPAGRPAADAALAGPGPLALAGMQLAFGRNEADARLAFERLGRTLETAGASWDRVAVLRTYALSRPLGEQARKTESEFLRRAPAGAAVRVEGLPSLDASFALDAVAFPHARP